MVFRLRTTKQDALTPLCRTYENSVLTNVWASPVRKTGKILQIVKS